MKKPKRQEQTDQAQMQDFERQMELARKIMRERADVLRLLART